MVGKMKKAVGHPSSPPGAGGVRMWRVDDLGGVEFLSATLTGFAFGTHAHEEFVVSLTEAGRGKPVYRGASHLTGPGDLIVLNPEEAHTCGTPKEDSWRYWVLYAPADLMHDITAELGVGRPSDPEFGDVIRDRELAALLRRVLGQSRSPRSSVLERESGMSEALMLLVGRHAKRQRSPRSVRPEHPAVARAREYLEVRARENVSLRTLAEYAGLSPFHLARVFRTSIGMTPHAYQTQIRVRHARSLLRAGRPIDQVATEVGFFDQAHLTRHFKRIVGMPPGRYVRDVAPG